MNPGPPVGDTRDPDPCICGHDEDEHTLAGCDSYTPTWPRLVRCPCTEFQPDRIASDNPVPVDESAVTDFLNTVGDTTQPQPTDDEIVEAVAEAMADADDGIIYGLLTPEEADFYQRMARAAIAALDEAGCL